MTALLTGLAVGAVVGFVFFLGYVEGRHVERQRERRALRKQRWMVREAVRRWSPWDKDEAVHIAELAAAYREEER